MTNNKWLKIWCLSFLFFKCDSFFEIPHIEIFTFPSHVVIGKNISAFCSAKDATFAWLKDGKMLTNSTNVLMKSKEDYTLIIIKAVSVHSEGNYTCIAMNKFGFSSQSTILTVITPPTWLIEPFDLVAVIGEKVSLECLTDELSKEIINWQKLDKNETITKTMPFNLLNGSIIFNAMKIEDEGEDKCIVDNTTPVIKKENPIKMKNKEIPTRFDDKFKKITIEKGHSVTLLCEAIGDLPLSIIWKKDGKELQNIRGGRYEISEMPIPSGLKSELFLREVDRTDNQIYTCLTENSYGKNKKDIYLLVMEVPSIPLDLKVEEVLKRRIKVSWSTPYTGNSPISKYIIQYWRHTTSEGRHRLEEKTISSAQTSVLLKNLHPGVNYGLVIIAENALGRGEPSKIVSFTTREEEPSGAPTDINVDNKGAESLIVIWKPPMKNERNGQLKGYYIGYKINFDPSHNYSFREVQYVQEEIQEYIITKLRKDTEYSIIVKAFNSAGIGPASQDVLVRTLVGDLPLAPTVSAVSSTENSIDLEWRSNGPSSVITGYVIHYQKKGDIWKRETVTSANASSFNLKGLQSGAFYQIYISANSEYEEGYPSNVIIAETNAVDNSTSLIASIIEQQPEIDMAHIIPVTTSVLTAIVISVVALVWVLKAKSRKNLEKSIQEDKCFIFAKAKTQMHDHLDKTKKSLLTYHDPDSIHFSTPYETALIKDISDSDQKDGPNKKMKSVLAKKMEERLLLNAVTLKKLQHQKQQESKKMYESLELSKHTDLDNSKE